LYPRISVVLVKEVRKIGLWRKGKNPALFVYVTGHTGKITSKVQLITELYEA
jgi:hypothetical protein